jgi:hypothetical protein
MSVTEIIKSTDTNGFVVATNSNGEEHLLSLEAIRLALPVINLIHNYPDLPGWEVTNSSPSAATIAALVAKANVISQPTQ